MLLLRGVTLTETCLMCHDGTAASIGVYTSITAHAGEDAVAAEHSYDLTNVVPGGTDLDHNLYCSDCHSVHGANTVSPFVRDAGAAFASSALIESDCLLRNNLKGSAAGTYPVYGAQWCAACHEERHSASVTTVNHPVSTAADWGYGEVTSTPVYSFYDPEYPEDYDYPLRAADPTGVFNGYIRGMGQTNGSYVMEPVDAGADGRVDARREPLCQQCHEDARDVEQIYTGDVYSPGTGLNPEFMTFPHQTTNDNMLVETGDDLCLNCHVVGG